MRIFPQRRVLPFQQRRIAKLNKVVKIVHSSTGLVIDSDTIVSRKLPDGRVEIDLSPALKAQLGLQ